MNRSTAIVVVSSQFGDEEHDNERQQREERRGLDRRVHDHAVVTAYAVAGPLCAGQAVIYGLDLVSLASARSTDTIGPWWVAAAALSWSLWLTLLLVFHYAWHSQGDMRRWRRLLTAAVLLNLTVTALHGWLPWLRPVQIDAALSLTGLLGSCLLVALSVPMLPMLASAACGIAVASTALQLISMPLDHASGWLLCSMLAALAGWTSRQSGRHWHEQTRALFERQDHQAQLRAEHDRAVRAEQDMSRFIATASHDLRQPMHALGLFVATLEQRLQHTPEETLVRNMMRSVESLDRSFSALLDVSRIDAGALQPHMQRFALRDLFRRLHLHFAGQAEAAGLSLRLSPGGKFVCSDPQLLERVLGNLVQNAIKYTRQGGVVVVARTTRTHLNIEVWDTGIGISAHELPHIFDEFYQVDGQSRRHNNGLGMGLAIVKRLVQLLGHRLSVASRPGRGSMFRISVSLGDQDALLGATSTDTVPAPVFQARTVLVIDDEEPIREGLRLLLEEWGFDALTAASLAQARRITDECDGQIDLILCDLHLSHGEDGLQAIQLVRKLAGRAVPAIVITGDTSPVEIRRASASGNPVLFKPVQPRQLMAALHAITPE
ncbi:MAG: hypothetical protein RLY71_2693 [Pseudomonadota bacterium]